MTDGDNTLYLEIGIGFEQDENGECNGELHFCFTPPSQLSQAQKQEELFRILASTFAILACWGTPAMASGGLNTVTVKALKPLMTSKHVLSRFIYALLYEAILIGLDIRDEWFRLSMRNFDIVKGFPKKQRMDLVRIGLYMAAYLGRLTFKASGEGLADLCNKSGSGAVWTSRNMSMTELSKSLNYDRRSAKKKLGAALIRNGQWCSVNLAIVTDPVDAKAIRDYLKTHPTRPKRIAHKA